MARKEADTDIFRNPFRSGAAVTGEYFRDRRDEVTRLAGYMGSGHNAVIIAPRRQVRGGYATHLPYASARPRRSKISRRLKALTLLRLAV